MEVFSGGEDSVGLGPFGADAIGWLALWARVIVLARSHKVGCHTVGTTILLVVFRRSTGAWILECATTLACLGSSCLEMLELEMLAMTLI